MNTRKTPPRAALECYATALVLGTLVPSAWAQCTVESLPMIDACAGSTMNLSLGVSGGVEPYDHFWWPNSGLSSASDPGPVLQVEAGITSYTLTVTDALGCVATGSVQVNGWPLIQAQFSSEPSDQICAGNSITFGDQAATLIPNGAGLKRVWSITPATGWSILGGDLGSTNGQSLQPDQWTSGTGELDVLFATSGAYVVTLIVAGSCGISSASTPVSVSNVPAQPVVATNSPLCVGQTLSLSAAPQAGVVYHWAGPTGSIAMQPSVTVAGVDVAQAGMWTVVATMGNCPAPPTTVEVMLTTPPVISVTPGFTSLCAGESVDFTASGADELNWYIGGSVVMNGPSLSVTPSSTTTYTVVGQSGGCTGYASVTTLVNALPVPSFEVGPVACGGLPLSFTNSGTGASAWQWDLGDGTTSNAASPTHTYLQAGIWPVTITATSLAGCSTTHTDEVTVWDTPTAQITTNFQSGCAPLTVAFNGGSNGTGVSLAWDLGDGGISFIQAPTHTYASEGVYQATVIHTNAGGCSAMETQTISVLATPTGSFTLADTLICGLPTVVMPQTDILGANAFDWALDGNQVASDPAPAIPIITAGQHLLTLTASNASGCSVQYSSVLFAEPAVVAAFSVTPSVLCAGSDLSLISASSGAVGQQWWVGGVALSNVADPVLPCTIEGVHDVMLIAWNGACMDTLLLPNAITVLPSPRAQFDHAVLEGNIVQFQDRSEGSVQTSWDLGEGSRSDQASFMHNYPAAGGAWEVCLTVSNAEGCADTICQRIVLDADPMLFAPNAFTPNGDGINDHFQPHSSGFAEWTYHLEIYDRWGTRVFSGTDRNLGWSGEGATASVYVWRVTLRGSGQVREFNGHVTLIR